MADTLRLAIGIVGNAASLLLYAAPILTFKRVVRKRSTEGFSCLPYIVALLNCLLYTWYGLPVVSCGWENLTVVTVNGLGVLLELSFVLIYLWFASAQNKKVVSSLAASVLVVFVTTASVSAFALRDHHHRKVLVGSIGVLASVSMYSSPLVAVKQVIKTKSVEFMPFYLSFFAFLASSLWMIYGLLGRDLFVASPSLLGTPVGALQLVLYFMYRKSDGIPPEPVKFDVEKNGLQLMQIAEPDQMISKSQVTTMDAGTKL